MNFHMWIVHDTIIQLNIYKLSYSQLRNSPQHLIKLLFVCFFPPCFFFSELEDWTVIPEVLGTPPLLSTILKQKKLSDEFVDEDFRIQPLLVGTWYYNLNGSKSPQNICSLKWKWCFVQDCSYLTIWGELTL